MNSAGSSLLVKFSLLKFAKQSTTTESDISVFS